MPAHRKRQETVALRVLASLFGILTLEVWFQWRTLPDTAWKALIAAVLTETGLPPTVRIFANAIVALVKALAPLIAPR